MNRYLMFFVLLLTVTLAGCINYDEETQVNADGSGKVSMHYSLSQQLTAMMAMGNNSGGGEETDEMPFRFKDEEIRQDLQATGVRVDSISSKVENEEQHFYVDISFDHITDLNNTKTFREMPFEWTAEGDTISIRRILKGKEAAAESGDSSNQMGDQMAQAMFGNAAFKFKLILPGKALPSPDTNGKILEDGKTVTWEFPLTQLGKGDKVMEAKFQTGGASFGMLSWIFIGGAGLISVICIVIVIMVARKM